MKQSVDIKVCVTLFWSTAALLGIQIQCFTVHIVISYIYFGVRITRLGGLIHYLILLPN